MASPRELAEQRRGVIARHVRVVARPCGIRALNARTRVREQVRAGALERSGPHPSGCSALERDGLRSRGEGDPSSKADPARGRRDGLERGGPRPRERLSLE
jgi:hypothetical protein